MNETYPFLLQPLPYAYDALEPFIDEETVRLHHDGHLKAYVDKLNKILAPYPALHHWPLERLIFECHTLPGKIQTDVRNNAGGVYNHNLYFASMQAPDNQQVPQPLYQQICTSFGGWKEFQDAFSQAAANQFGSGYSWLAVGYRKSLKIINTPNQDTPLPKNLRPLLPLDVWEHAYYLKYKNKRMAYIQNWFSLVHWDAVNERFLSPR